MIAQPRSPFHHLSHCVSQTLSRIPDSIKHASICSLNFDKNPAGPTGICLRIRKVCYKICAECDLAKQYTTPRRHRTEPSHDSVDEEHWMLLKRLLKLMLLSVLFERSSQFPLPAAVLLQI